MPIRAVGLALSWRSPHCGPGGLVCSEMPTQCFTKKGSDPPICSVHNVKLEERQTSRESITGGVGNFTYLVCPVSGTVLNDDNAHAYGHCAKPSVSEPYSLASAPTAIRDSTGPSEYRRSKSSLEVLLRCRIGSENSRELGRLHLNAGACS